MKSVYCCDISEFSDIFEFDILRTVHCDILIKQKPERCTTCQPYSDIQLDMFQTYCPSSRVLILYSQQLVFVTLRAISKLEYFGHIMHKSDSMKKDLILGLTFGGGK